MPSDTDTSAQIDLEALLDHIRPAVRREKAYRVAVPPETSVKLNQNESPFDLPADFKHELLEAFEEIPFNRYPSDQPEALRQALARYTGHDAEGILIGNGSNELTYTLGLALVEKGTSVVLPRPMFALYETVVHLYGGALASVPPRSDLSFDAERLLEAIDENTPALVVLTSPNNPTGLAMPFGEIEAIVKAAPGFVVVDEAYVEFNDEESAQVLLRDHPNVIVLRTFSKAFGLAGLRLGFLLGHPSVIQELMKARLPFMVDRFAERVGMAVLERLEILKERVRRIKASCQELTEALQTMDGVEVVPSQANFVLFKPAAEPRAVMDRLAEEGVLVRNMGGYPALEGYLRVNAGTSEENKAFLTALEKALRSEAGA